MGRKPLDRVQKHYRVAPETPEKLSKLAVQLGYLYGKGGAVGEMMDAIASGELLIISQENWEKLNKKT